MKKLIMAISLIIILGVGIYSVAYMQSNIPITYDGRGTDVYELQQNPENYDTSNPDGVASIMVQENLAKTHGKASDCIACRKCERSCPQHLPIVEDLKQVAALFEK